MKGWGRILLAGLPTVFILGCPDLFPQACEEDADCPEGQICVDGACAPEDECDADEDCPEGEVCENGACVPEDECDSDDDCAEGEVCENGECVADGGNGGDPVAGEAFYTANNCGACHAADGSGGIGPNIQDATAAEILANLDGSDNHPVTVQGVTQEDAEDVAAFLATQ